VNRSAVPVLTVRAADEVSPTFPYTDILVPTDGSDHATAALELASTVAHRHGARLHLLSVVDELPEVIDAGSAELPEQLEEKRPVGPGTTRRRAPREQASTTSRPPSPRVGAREVTAYADEQDIDLVVMGTHRPHRPRPAPARELHRARDPYLAGSRPHHAGPG